MRNSRALALAFLAAGEHEQAIAAADALNKPTLNDVYLQYTGKSMRDAEESRENVFRQRIAMRRARQ